MFPRIFFKLSVALVVGVGICAPVQGASWFENRHAAIEKELSVLPPETTGTILMLGDSITERMFSEYKMPRTIHGLRVFDEGIGGDNIGTSVSTTGVMSRLDQVKRAKPAIIFLMIGVNDLWVKEEDVSKVIKRYEDMLARLKATVPDAKLVLESVLPARGGMNYVNPKVLALNARIKSLASENGAVWLDLHSLMKDENGELKAEYTGDNVHLTEPAFEVWEKQIRATVDELLR
jgi:lysophospholipase L1-like esterase